MQEKELIPRLFKTEYSKIIAVLCKLFGSNHLEVAEDIVHDTFLLASETWGLKSIPDNPTAWLYTVAKNKTIDYLRRNKVFAEKVSAVLSNSQAGAAEPAIDLSGPNIEDSQLRMLFVVCNPAIPKEAQVGLALRILCGFGIDEIAEAFLSNKETINKRLLRARQKLREENISTDLPAEKEMGERLEAVLTTIYLLFNEGYYSSTQNSVLRKELCMEAMRLCYFLLQHAATNTPPVNSLLSLMCFHASRFDARLDAAGEHVLYEAQDRELWNDDLIEKGNYYLIQSAQGQQASRYHLEAAIAYWHCQKTPVPGKWEEILDLYNKLLMLEYSPVAALNRTYALSRVKGKAAAIREAEQLQLSGSHLYHSLLGNLYTGVDGGKAAEHYQTALQLARTEHDRAVIMRHLKAL
ncbi:sigma-70 family RNA polymerase sigma factor [Chitinophaga lutea]|uniref:Sigma-70 family RNA polymerase sigma factor n=1 Tax=Chitinophaga lutea TaxID=2488634 RepID=A0A3N4Q8V1_9BACT|nr:sigma-70 family RNA polymerase sigma factor [Chitinophaga lutea]RPE12430.1 sigma-70 family RNA polymerase sigma factor [Chitinophaga lutea]